MKNFETFIIEDLDVQELENRLEMSIMEASSAGWIRTDPPPFPNPPLPVPDMCGVLPCPVPPELPPNN